MTKRIIQISTGMLTILLLTGCVPNDGTYTSENPAGFLWGLWHGVITIITFLMNVFTGDYAIYEINNSGWAYNLGFLLGVCCSLGGGISIKLGKSKED